MERNIKGRKRRIVHNKNDPPDSRITNTKFESLHFVSQTTSDMDSNFISNNLTAPADSSVNKKTTAKKEYFLRTRKIQTEGTDVKKAKRKLVPNKKFPLMEKSQKNLMHLTHNRRWPKPRAHLASLGISPVCDNTNSGTGKKVENNSRKTANSRKPTATNENSVKRNNLKHSETSKKIENACRKVSPSLSATSNKISATRDNPRKSDVGKKVGNTSRKVSPYGSVSTNFKVNEWLDNYFKGGTLENTKESNVFFFCRNKTFVTNNCSKNDDCHSVSDINDDTRNEFRESETSDSEYEKFVQYQKEALNLKKRRKKQPTTARKNIKQKSSSPKRKNAKKDAEVRYSSESECESLYNPRSKRCKKRNKSTNNESRKKKSGKNNAHLSKDESESDFEQLKNKSRKKSSTTVLSEDECESDFDEFKDKSRNNSGTTLPEDESQSVFEEYDDNCVYIRNPSSDKMSDDEVVNLRVEAPQTKSKNERVLMPELNSFDVTHSIESNVLVASNPNLNVSTDSTEENPKNKQVLTSEINALGAKNKVSDELSVNNSRLVADANNSVQESPETPILIDLCLNDDECKSSESTTQFISSKSVVTENVISTVSTSESQSDDESDLEIVDVVLSYEKLNNVTADNKHSANISINAANMKIEKQTDSNLDKLQTPQSSLHMQKNKAIAKHEAAFSTDICSKLSETNSEHGLLDHKVDDVVENNVNKKEKCDDIMNKVNKKEKCDDIMNKVNKKEKFDEDIIVLSDEKAFANISNSSRTASNARTGSDANAIGESSSCKKEQSLKKLTDEAESISSRDKLLYEVACSNLKIPTTDNKPTKFSSLSPDDMTSMDITSLVQMFKTEFKNYKEIIEFQEAIINSFRLLENRKAEKLLSLKSAIKRYIESFGCKNSSILDIPMGKIEFVDSKILERNPGMSSMNTITISNAEGVENQASWNFSQDDQKFKDSSKGMSFGEKCIVCSEDAVTACQQCFKVFFCSDKCRKTYWDAGHGRICRK